jgi:hypothetical protein
MGEASALPIEVNAKTVEIVAALMNSFTVATFKYRVIDSPVVNKKSTNTKCAWII